MMLSTKIRPSIYLLLVRALSNSWIKKFLTSWLQSLNEDNVELNFLWRASSTDHRRFQNRGIGLFEALVYWKMRIYPQLSENFSLLGIFLPRTSSLSDGALTILQHFSYFFGKNVSKSRRRFDEVETSPIRLARSFQTQKSMYVTMQFFSGSRNVGKCIFTVSQGSI